MMDCERQVRKTFGRIFKWIGTRKLLYKAEQAISNKGAFFFFFCQAWLLVTSSISPYSCLDNNMKMVYCCLLPVLFLISQSSFQLQYSLEISHSNINKLSFQNESKSVRYCHLDGQPWRMETSRIFKKKEDRI